MGIDTETRIRILIWKQTKGREIRAIMVTDLQILNLAFAPISDDESDQDVDLGDTDIEDEDEEDDDADEAGTGAEEEEETGTGEL